MHKGILEFYNKKKNQTNNLNIRLNPLIMEFFVKILQQKTKTTV